jgi:hypothetical protein
MVAAIAGLTNRHVRAADAPANATTLICTGRVPDDAFAAVVLYPRRVLKSDAMAKLDVKTMASEFEKVEGFSPFEFEQLVILAGPRVAGSWFPKLAAIGRLREPHDGGQLAGTWVGPDLLGEDEVVGHKYFHRKAAPRIGDDPDVFGLSMFDSHTFVLSSETWLPKIFSSRSAKSLLISELSASDPSDDATIIFTNTDAAKAMIADAMPAKSLTEPLKAVGNLPDLLRVAKLSIWTNPEISLKLTLSGNDDDAAGKMARMIKSFQQSAQDFLPMVKVPPGENLPAEVRESRELTISTVSKLVKGLVPHQVGKQVTVEIRSVATLETMVGKVALPEIRNARSAAQRAR